MASGVRLSELYQRVLLWHKLVAQTTGGLALCSAKGRLPRGEALAWTDALRRVSDEIQSVLDGTGFILDSKGQRLVGSVTGRASPEFFNKESINEKVASDTNNGMVNVGVKQAVGPQKAGGLRVAKRKTK